MEGEMQDLDVQIGALAQRQHGRFSIEDVQDLGGSNAEVEHRLCSGRWIAEHRGVYRLAGVPLTWDGRAVAACLTGGRHAVVSHLSAAHVWFPAAFGPAG